MKPKRDFHNNQVPNEQILESLQQIIYDCANEILYEAWYDEQSPSYDHYMTSILIHAQELHYVMIGKYHEL